MSPLPDEDRAALVRLARQAITAVVAGGQMERAGGPWAGSPRRGGVFVSLHWRGALRGCIGQVETAEPLGEAVARCAAAAALEDPRFDPVRPEELPELEVEVSILSPLERISPETVQVGTHGLLVSRGALRGLLLPQVAAERNWSRERFLEETCAKAGLERDAWKQPGTRMEAFTAEVFSERDVAGARLKQTG